MPSRNLQPTLTARRCAGGRAAPQVPPTAWRRRGRGWLGALSLWLALAAPLAVGGEPAAGPDAEPGVPMPLAGIALTPPAGYAAVPLPAPAEWLYEVKDTREQFKAYLPAELWRRDQVGAQFQGATGELLVARLRHLPPVDLPLVNEQHVREADYQAAVAQLATEWTPDAIRAWIATLAGAAPTAPENLAKTVAATQVQRVTFADAEAAAWQGRLLLLSNGDRVLLLVRFAPGLAVAETDPVVAAVVKSVRLLPKPTAPAGPPPATPETGGVGANGGTPGAAPPVGADPAPAQSVRQRVIEGVGKRPNWWYRETANFVLQTDLTARDGELVERIGGELEVLRAIAERFLPPAAPLPNTGVITVFRNRAEFRRLVPKAQQQAAAWWHAELGELLLAPFTGPNQHQAVPEFTAQLYHEALRQYLHAAFAGGPLPAWFAAGHAALYESLVIAPERGAVELTEDAARQPRLQTLLANGPPDLARLLALEAAAFRDPRTGADQETLAWGLVYFLRRAADQHPGRGYERLCPAVLAAARRPAPAAEAAADPWRTLDLNRLARDLQAFWVNPARRRAAERQPLLEPARRDR